MIGSSTPIIIQSGLDSEDDKKGTTNIYNKKKLTVSFPCNYLYQEYF